MNIPKFNADIVLSKNGGQYRSNYSILNQTDRIYPSAEISNETAAMGSQVGQLNAFGCWEARCCVQTGLRQVGGRWVWYCKRSEPCKKCIWPF